MKTVDYLMIGATIRIGREILRLLYAGFFFYIFPQKGLSLYSSSVKRSEQTVALPGMLE